MHHPTLLNVIRFNKKEKKGSCQRASAPPSLEAMTWLIKITIFPLDCGSVQGEVQSTSFPRMRAAPQAAPNEVYSEKVERHEPVQRPHSAPSVHAFIWTFPRPEKALVQTVVKLQPPHTRFPAATHVDSNSIGLKICPSVVIFTVSGFKS